MNKTKAIFVTALVAVLLAAIIVCLYLLKLKVYIVLAGMLGLYGFACAAYNFCRWLGNEQKSLIPPAPHSADLDVPEVVQGEEVFTATYDQIKAELGA